MKQISKLIQDINTAHHVVPIGVIAGGRPELDESAFDQFALSAFAKCEVVRELQLLKRIPLIADLHNIFEKLQIT